MFLIVVRSLINELPSLDTATHTIINHFFWRAITLNFQQIFKRVEKTFKNVFGII